jgi:hypothetical protein
MDSPTSIVSRSGGWDTVVGYGITRSLFKVRFSNGVIVRLDDTSLFRPFHAEATRVLPGEFKRIPKDDVYVRAWMEDVRELEVERAFTDALGDACWNFILRWKGEASSIKVFSFNKEEMDALLKEWTTYLTRPRMTAVKQEKEKEEEKKPDAWVRVLRRGSSYPNRVSYVVVFHIDGEEEEVEGPATQLRRMARRGLRVIWEVQGEKMPADWVEQPRSSSS